MSQTKENLILTKSIKINSSASHVWEALTNPNLIKKYLFGTETHTDWKKGSPISFIGEWEGKTYEDKGTITEIEKDKILKYTYWSSMSGKKDVPENYNNITYKLSSENGATLFTLIQDGIESEESKAHSDKNWTMVLEGLKKTAEEL